MKFTSARRFCTDAAVLSAFGAIALGGALSLVASLSLLLVLLCAFALEGRFASCSRWLTAAVVLLLPVLVGLFVSDAMELAVAASSFAVSLAVHRLLTRQGASDDPALFMTALLMLTGAAALTAELLYALCFVVFALAATMALVLSQLERSVVAAGLPGSGLDRMMDWRLASRVAILSMLALVVASGLFFIFPRMTAGAFARKSTLGGKTGVASEIRLDAGGIVKDDPRPAMRVRMDPDVVDESLDVHWRGRVFEEYDGVSWKGVLPPEVAPFPDHPHWRMRGGDGHGADASGRNEAAPLRRRDLQGSAEEETAGEPDGGRRKAFPTPRVRFGGRMRPRNASASVEVLPAASEDFAFVPEGTVRLEQIRAQRRQGTRQIRPVFFLPSEEGQVSLNRSVPEGFVYRVDLEASSTLDREPSEAGGNRFAQVPVLESGAFSSSALSAEGSASSLYKGAAVPGRLLELPSTLDPKVGQLAHRLTDGETSLSGKVRALESHLSSFAYSRDLPGDVADPLADFLFVRREGHCELFATAMAVMLRSVGIPARTVGGFYGGTRTEEGDYLVRLAAAHAWVEVYVPGFGFVISDPTPPQGREGQASGFVTWIIDTYEEMSARWQKVVVDLTLWDQWRAIRDAGRAASRHMAAFQRRREGVSAGFGNWLKSVQGNHLALAAVAALLALLGVRLARGRRSKDARGWDGDPLAMDLRRHLLSALRERGVVPEKGETLREALCRPELAGDPFLPAAKAVAERLLASRFGGRRVSRDEAKRLRRFLKSGATAGR